MDEPPPHYETKSSAASVWTGMVLHLTFGLRGGEDALNRVQLLQQQFTLLFLKTHILRYRRQTFF